MARARKQTNSNKIKVTGGDLIFSIVNGVIMTFTCIILLYPLWYVLVASVTDPVIVSSGKFLLYPTKLYIEGYERAMKYSPLWMGYKNTLIYTDVNRMFISPCRIGNLYIVSVEVLCRNTNFFDELSGENRKNNTTAVP